MKRTNSAGELGAISILPALQTDLYQATPATREPHSGQQSSALARPVSLAAHSCNLSSQQQQQRLSGPSTCPRTAITVPFDRFFFFTSSRANGETPCGPSRLLGGEKSWGNSRPLSYPREPIWFHFIINVSLAYLTFYLSARPPASSTPDIFTDRPLLPSNCPSTTLSYYHICLYLVWAIIWTTTRTTGLC